MELIPNIRFNTVLMVSLALPILFAVYVLQADLTIVKVMFGAYVVLVFGIGFWHSAKTMPPPPEE